MISGHFIALSRCMCKRSIRLSLSPEHKTWKYEKGRRANDHQWQHEYSLYNQITAQLVRKYNIAPIQIMGSCGIVKGIVFQLFL